MAATPNSTPAATKTTQQGFVYLPLIVGWLVPGAGHFLVRKWGRGALLALAIVSMFVLGLAMQGKVYSGAHDILDILGLGADSVQVTTADYGTRFIVVAGLLNVIAAVDAHNLRTGRKPL
jgi:hypothetical protein